VSWIFGSPAPAEPSTAAQKHDPFASSERHGSTPPRVRIRSRSTSTDEQAPQSGSWEEVQVTSSWWNSLVSSEYNDD